MVGSHQTVRWKMESQGSVPDPGRRPPEERVGPSGEWPMPGHDNTLSARADLPCRMGRAPREVWSHSMGETPVDWATCADVDDDGEEEVLYGSHPLVCVDMSGTEKWRADVGALVAITDVNGDGATEIVADGPVIVSGRTGEVLWRRTGQEIVGRPRIHVGEFLTDRTGLQIGCVSQQYYSNQAQMWAFDRGYDEAELVWEREFNTGPVYAHATSSAGRFDAHRMCVAAAVHGGIVAMDAEDGTDLFRCYWEPRKGEGICRNYGALYVGDLDGDGTSEFLLLNDSISLQLGVLSPARGSAGASANQETPWPSPDVGYGDLAAYASGPIRWRRYFGFWYPQDRHTLHISPTSIADVDGDGIPELVVSVHGDRWDLKVYDILSGEEKLSVPDMYLHGTLDLDGDGVAEIIAANERTRTPRQFTELAIGRATRSGWDRLLELDGCRLEHGTNPIWSLGFYGRNKDPRTPIVLEDGSSRQLVLSRDESGAGRADSLLLVSGAPGQDWAVRRIALDSRNDTKVLAAGKERMITTRADATMQALDLEGRDLATWRCGSPFVSGVAVADIDGDGANELVFSDAKRRVVALAAPSKGDAGPRELWSADGWGIPAAHTYGPMPIIVDFEGDGKREVIAACVADGGEVAIQAIDHRGRVKWRTPVPGAVDTPLYPSITCATVGDFNGDGHSDLYVSGRVAMTGNDAAHSFVLRGRDGTVLWHNDASDPSLDLHTLGPTALAAVADVDGDGADDVLLIALDMCTVLSGRDGSFIQAPVIANEIWQQQGKSTQWTAYGTQLPVDLDGDGQLEVLMCASWGQWGAWTMDQRLVWTFDPGLDEHSRRHPGIADVDGDGKLEIGVLHSEGHFRCYDAATGLLKWELEDVAGSSDVVTADVDGDGRCEFVVGGNALLAIKAVSDDRGEVLWQLPLPGGSRTPAIADVDGDGLCEIVVGCGDGMIRIYK